MKKTKNIGSFAVSSSLSNMPSRKASRKTTLRGEAIIYEKSEIEGMCNGCLWSSSGSCTIWKYRKPSICIIIKKRLNQRKSRAVTNPDLILRFPIKILSYWNPETRKKEFSYYIVKKRLDNLGWHIISSRKTNQAGYLRCIEKNEKKEQKAQKKLSKFVPVNPWIVK